MKNYPLNRGISIKCVNNGWIVYHAYGELSGTEMFVFNNIDDLALWLKKYLTDE